MTEGLWALGGVALGGLVSGLTSWRLQVRQFAHVREMWKLEHQSEENVKAILNEMLEHRAYTDRSFVALTKPIGGYEPDQVRKFLHEIGAKRATRTDGEEWWYLVSRQDERVAKRLANSTA